MKKIFATLLAASLMFAATDAFAQLSAGLGYINATETGTYTNNNSVTNLDPQAFNGVYVGANYSVDMASGLSLVPGVYMSALFGSKHVDVLGLGLLSGDHKYTEFAINVPINVAFNYALNHDTKLFAYAGPIMQFALSHKDAFTGTGSNTTTTYDLLNGDDQNRNPFNLYIGGGIGAQVANIQIILGYDHSLLNIDSRDGYKRGRSAIKLGVGMAF